MDINRTFTWEMPARLVVGLGVARTAGAELKKMGASKVLITTDKGVESAGILAGIVEGLESAGVAYAVFTGVEANPSIHCVNEAVAMFEAERCDGFLGIGGGSSMDTAKAAGAVLANRDMDIRAMEGVGKIPNPIAPLVAIPTTCGTGSEVTVATVITDTERHYKIPILSPFLIPKVSLIDGTLLTKLPGKVVAATGMDALCHAIESYTNLNTNPISDALDLKAISMISEWLRPAVANQNTEAMCNMVLAATMAGMGFSNTRLTIVHSISQPVGGYYGVAHGIANAVILPHVMDFNLLGNAQRFADIAVAMGEDITGLTLMDAARLAPAAVRALSKDIGIPENFKELGVTDQYVDGIVEDTFKSGNVPVNPVKVTREAVESILRKSIG